MRISDEIIHACAEAAEYCVFQGFQNNFEDVARAAIQAYLSEIWKPFDAEDESTWPSEEARYYFVLFNSGLTEVIFWDGDDPDDFERWLDVTHYLDPTDILPKEDK